MLPGLAGLLDRLTAACGVQGVLGATTTLGAGEAGATELAEGHPGQLLLLH